jgi:hypothetical protein
MVNCVCAGRGQGISHRQEAAIRLTLGLSAVRSLGDPPDLTSLYFLRNLNGKVCEHRRCGSN